MESQGVGEEAAAPLVVVTEEVGSCSTSEKRQPKNHARDVHILSFAFLFVFSAYGAAQNLESTVNTVSFCFSFSIPIILLIYA